ncbi:MAG TPA: hypothetical protein VGH80_07375 [Xanthomonadaceae bacterium]|jgi:hypothetical protein
MHIRSARHFLVPIAFTVVLAACGSGKAPDTATVTQPLALPPDSNAAPASASASASSSSPVAASASVATTPIPTATDDIWKALDKQSYGLQKAIDGGAWKDARARADAVRDLAAALPAHASKLPADQQAALQQNVTLIATYVDKLDAAAGSGDAAAAKDNYKKVNEALGGITRFP